MGNFFKDVIERDRRFSAPERIADLNLLEPVTRSAVAGVIARARAEGAFFVPFETFRSRERQRCLFLQGSTQLEEVGVHHYGLACDLVRVVDGRLSWDAEYSALGRLAPEFHLIWGGNWGHPGRANTFIDAAHVQRCTVERQPELFAGYWYPTPEYDVLGDLDDAS